MASTSVSGLVSGLDTASIINQLMQLEAQPQAQLKSRVTTQTNQKNALQTLNAKLAGIATKAADLAKGAAWSPAKTSSTNDKVTLTADDGAAATSLSLTVQAVATAERNVYTTTGTAAAAATETAATSFTITFDGGSEAYTFDTGDGSLADIAEALNDPDSGVKASLVKTGTTTVDGKQVPTYQLHVVSAETGKDSGFSIARTDDATTGLLGGVASTTAGQDAEITVNGQSLTSSSNTITDLVPGVDVTIDPTLDVTKDAAATVSVSRDPGALADKISSLVDSVNAALADIDSLTDYEPDTKAAGLLTGNSLMRQIRNQLLESVSNGFAGESLASVGLQTDRDGTLVFDEAAFTEAYDADPVGTAHKFAGTVHWEGTGSAELRSAGWRTQPGSYTVTASGETGTLGGRPATVTGDILTGATGSPVEDLSLDLTRDANGEVSGTLTYTQGFAARLEAITQRLSNPDTGTVTGAIQSREDAIDGLTDDIADWDIRLDMRRKTMERQYAALEVALGKLQNQASWLNGQIASLPSMSSD
jgi:flagellar hook-associated protein 2